MALATKRKQPAHARKRQAQHHRRSKNYMKPYLPYIPMAAIAAGGGIVNAVWDASSSVAMADPLHPAASTRLFSLFGTGSYTLLYFTLAVTFAAFALFISRHWYRVHKLVYRGEAFVVKNPLLDICLFFIVTAGVVLTRVN